MHDVIGDDDRFLRVLGVAFRVTHGAALDAALAVPCIAVGVAKGVAGRRSQKGDIYGQFAGFNGVGPAAVGTEDHRRFHKPPGDFLGQFSPQARCFNAADNSVLYVLYKGRVAVG